MMTRAFYYISCSISHRNASLHTIPLGGLWADLSVAQRAKFFAEVSSLLAKTAYPWRLSAVVEAHECRKEPFL